MYVGHLVMHVYEQVYIRHLGTTLKMMGVKISEKTNKMAIKRRSKTDAEEIKQNVALNSDD
jgi:hypothetical protein